MKVLAVDPGYDKLGLAVLEKGSGRETLLYSSCFKTSASLAFFERLHLIGQEVARIVEKFSPETLAIENLFLEKNQKTAMRVAETRGVIIYEAKRADLNIKEFTPLEIKLSVSGNGRSDKKMMAKMVSLLIALPNRKIPDDELDAIAVGLTFFAHH